MKKRIPSFITFLFNLASICTPICCLAQPNHVLPDYDKRLTAPMIQDFAVYATRAEGISLLRSRVSNAVVNLDPLHGSPRMIHNRRGFLTGQGGRGGALTKDEIAKYPETDPHRVIKTFIDVHRKVFGHDAQLLTNAILQRDAILPHARARLTHWQQTVDGIPVFGATLMAATTLEEELVTVSSLFIADPESAANRGLPTRKSVGPIPKLDASDALRICMQLLEMEHATNETILAYKSESPQKTHRFHNPRLMQDATVRLRWFPLTPSYLRLCWEVQLWPKNHPGKYLVLVDAETGEVLLRYCLTRWLTPVTFRVFTNDSPTPLSPGWSEPRLDQPSQVQRVLVTLTNMSPVGSPIGWVEEGPNPVTAGNNAIAVGRNGLVVGPNRVFDYPLDLTMHPSNYTDASVVQLFFDANWFHDVLYEIGFTEAMGNYQNENFGRGGFPNDPVICLAQGISDNAYFQPAEDGESGYCVMGITTQPRPPRDSALDQEVVFHELTHGVSERVVGGGLALNRSQSGGLAEGWSDFFPFRLLSQETDDPDGCYASGAYFAYNIAGFPFANYYFGIRRYPYTTDLKKNPLTFKDIDPTQADPHLGVPINPISYGEPDEEHAQGEFWATVLHEMWALLVKNWGWREGNELALRLTFLGMALTPPEPTYIEARDAILLADRLLTGGANYGLLWQAFAKRGLGYSASCPPSYTTRGIREAFDLPPELRINQPDDILELRIVPETGAALVADSDETIYVHVTDAYGVPNATVTGRVMGEVIQFRNDGRAPDLRANDSTYTAAIRVPAALTNLTLTIQAEAQGKIGTTTTVSYIIIPRPPNDNFADAIKVDGDAYFISNNKLATLETNEPTHGGVASAAGSLWWKFTPPQSGTYLIDAGGSDKRTIIAVYTNTTLASLRPVASAIGSLNRKGPYLYLQAQQGTIYHVAVAGYDPNSLGSIRLRFLRSGLPDTNSPTINISTPLNGAIVETNVIQVTGFATDSGANPSGIRRIYVVVAPSDGTASTYQIIPPSYEWAGPITTNWSALIGLKPGRNYISAYAEDFSGNRSDLVSIEVTSLILDPPNDFFARPRWLTNSLGTNVINTLNATKELAEPNHAGVPGGKSIWFAFRAPEDGQLQLSTRGSDFDTVLAVYNGDSITNIIEQAYNDDASATNAFSEIRIGTKSNQVYRIVVDGYGGAFGRAVLTHQFTPCPVATLSISNTPGGTAKVYLDNATMNPPVCLPVGAAIQLKSAPYQDYQFDKWQIGSTIYLNDPLSLIPDNDLVVVPVFKPIAYTDGFEGQFARIGWVTTGASVGAAPWFVQTNTFKSGKWAARSGTIGHNQHSSLILTGKSGGGTLSFWYKVSSEQSYDKLVFLIDGQAVLTASGEVDWTRFVYYLEPGVHTLEWRYTKDATGSSGIDAAFIDNVDLPILPPLAPDSPANLAIGVSGERLLFIELTGQPNQMYVIQYSEDLRTWIPLYTNRALDGFIRIIDPHPVQSMRFYRAVVPVE